MKVAQLKSAPPFDSVRWQTYRIQSYGENNDFPQSVQEIVQASQTGSACLSIYRDFVFGLGFKDETVAKFKVNREGQTLEQLLHQIVNDYTLFGGFALHCNFNENYQISSLHWVPFENVRLELPDEDGQFFRVATHPDWGRRSKIYRRWSASKIEWFDLYCPNPGKIQQQVERAGEWENYKGQILYFSNSFEILPTYPIPLFISEMTDMRTEEGLANVNGRNVCSNFLSAGMLVEIDKADQDDQQLKDKQAMLDLFQGDENTSNLWYMHVKNKDDIPQFVSFSGENYDSAFNNTATKIPENIGRAFKQPPILRAVDVGAGFGADLITNAYKYYNSITANERQIITNVLTQLFDKWNELDEISNVKFDLQPLLYNAGATIVDRVGTEGLTQISEILQNAALTRKQKYNLIKFGYGLPDDQLLNLLPEAEV